MARGKKNCPKCNNELGGRTHLCSCGYHYPSGKMRKDLLKKVITIKGPKVYDTEGQGRKKCPDCNTIQAAIYQKCAKCGYDFSILAKKKKEEKAQIKAEKEKIRAEKQRLKDEVIAKKKAKREDKGQEKEISPLTKKLLLIPLPGEPKKITPKAHAKRILGYGEKRAKGLLHIAKMNKCWSHVDWGYVGERIK